MHSLVKQLGVCVEFEATHVKYLLEQWKSALSKPCGIYSHEILFVLQQTCVLYLRSLNFSFYFTWNITNHLEKMWHVVVEYSVYDDT